MALAAGIRLLPGWYNRLLWAGIAVLLAFAFTRLARWWVGRLASVEDGEPQLRLRRRRRETAADILTTAVRYLVVVVAAFAVLGIFVRNTLAAVGGATFVMVVVGFGFQRLLFDLVAGFLVLFESWYGVGDFVTLQPAGLSGVVEEFGLRTTVIRSLNGDRTFVPNGQITAVTRAPHGYRRYSVELLTSEPDAARRAVEATSRLLPAGEARFLRAPHVVEEKEVGEGVCLVRARCDVPPTMEWLAERFLPARLQAELAGDGLLAEPIVYTLDESAVSRYQQRSVFDTDVREPVRHGTRAAGKRAGRAGLRTRRRRDD
ncbi:MAG TPA: mechanosensitive ion channel family protein [Gaiellaceae bacterium]|nr:mechanosensitive ion channel family protein [Gaiellaceae bacterium]